MLLKIIFFSLSLSAFPSEQIAIRADAFPEWGLCHGPEIKVNGDIKSSWTITSSKTENILKGDVITLTFTGKPDKGWNLYSSNKEGEVGFLPTEFILWEEENIGIELAGPMKDITEAHEETDEIMGLIRHFEIDQVATFSQDIRITKESFKLKGSLKGQICLPDGMCVFIRGDVSWTGKASK